MMHGTGWRVLNTAGHQVELPLVELGFKLLERRFPQLKPHPQVLGEALEQVDVKAHQVSFGVAIRPGEGIALHTRPQHPSRLNHLQGHGRCWPCRPAFRWLHAASVAAQGQQPIVIAVAVFQRVS